MLRLNRIVILGSGTSLGLIGLFVPENKFDSNKVATENTSEEDQEDGINRVKKIFQLDQYGQYSPEVTALQQSSYLGFFMGALYGGTQSSRIAYHDFFQNNQAEVYNTQRAAKTKIQYEVSMAFAKGAWRWGWRIGLFTGAYMGISTIMSIYRGKSSVTDFSVAGLATGSLYKIGDGIRGTIVGGVLGGILGTVAGGASLLILKLSGTTMEDVRKAHHELIAYQDQVFRDAELKALNQDVQNSATQECLINRKSQESLNTLDSSPST